MVEPLSSLRLPQRQDVEIVLIRLDDGTIVARAAHELRPGEKVPVPPTPPPGQVSPTR